MAATTIEYGLVTGLGSDGQQYYVRPCIPECRGCAGALADSVDFAAVMQPYSKDHILNGKGRGRSWVRGPACIQTVRGMLLGDCCGDVVRMPNQIINIR